MGPGWTLCVGKVDRTVNCPSGRYRCHCGWFLSHVRAWVNREDEIQEVVGTCKRHGKQVVKDWDHEDFFPPKDGRLVIP